MWFYGLPCTSIHDYGPLWSFRGIYSAKIKKKTRKTRKVWNFRVFRVFFFVFFPRSKTHGSALCNYVYNYTRLWTNLEFSCDLFRGKTRKKKREKHEKNRIENLFVFFLFFFCFSFWTVFPGAARHGCVGCPLQASVSSRERPIGGCVWDATSMRFFSS